MKCTKCGGSGLWQYDENHAQPCPACCLHDKGVWLLVEHYGPRNGEWCCLAGCGTTWLTREEYEGGVRGLR